MIGTFYVLDFSQTAIIEKIDNWFWTLFRNFLNYPPIGHPFFHVLFNTSLTFGKEPVLLLELSSLTPTYKYQILTISLHRMRTKMRDYLRRVQHIHWCYFKSVLFHIVRQAFCVSSKNYSYSDNFFSR